MTIKELEKMIKDGCHIAYYNKQYDIVVIVDEKRVRKGLRIRKIDFEFL